MESIVVVAGKRTPFGSFGGSLKDVSATDLAIACSQETLKQVTLSPQDIDHVIFGNVIQSHKDSIYTPRHVGLKLGIPQHVPALGLNRLCGSGFESIAEAARLILTNEARIVLAGGTEQMSAVPYVARGARWGYRMGPGEMEDYLTAALVDTYTGLPMAITAENLAESYKISREDSDNLALRSQKRFNNAVKNGWIKEELCTVTVQDKKGNKVIEADEHPKPESTMETLAKLKPVFKKDGVVTAATASGIVDGAATCLVMAESEAKKRGLKPLVKLRSWASVGCDPKIMGIGPVYAVQKALQQAGMDLKQMDLVEVNEAFGAQYLAVEKELKLDPERTNVNGGAIAVGHPLAASGTRIMNHLMYELHRRNAKYAIGSACIGGGQGIALIYERV